MTSSDAYRYEFVSAETFFPIFEKLRVDIFPRHQLVDINTLYSPDEVALQKDLGKFQPLKLFLLAYDGHDVIGWSFGSQEQKTVFYMTNSAVLPDYRRQGVYTHLAQLMLERVRQEGFQKITSRHRIDNNPVIIAKLKLGFMIGGIELSDRFGTTVRLNYFPNRKREKLFRLRAGDTTLWHENKDFFGQ